MEAFMANAKQQDIVACVMDFEAVAGAGDGDIRARKEVNKRHFRTLFEEIILV